MRKSLAAIGLLLLLLAGCNNTQPTLKIGLVAPFEGRYRELGYEVVFAVRLALREVNASGGINGQLVELVALDDGGDPTLAAEQAEKLLTDPQVKIVIGHWLDETTAAALPIYAAAGRPVIVMAAQPDLAPGQVRLFATAPAIAAAVAALAEQVDGLACATCDGVSGADFATANPNTDIVGGPLWGLQQFNSLTLNHSGERYWVASGHYPAQTSEFSLAYTDAAGGVATAGVWAALAYDAAQVALAALAGPPDMVGETLAQVQLSGQNGPIGFDTQGEWIQPPLTAYQWVAGQPQPIRDD